MSTLKTRQKNQNVALVDVLDRVLEKGAVVEGDVSIRLADIDLVYVALRLMVTSSSKAQSLYAGEGKIQTTRENEKLSKEDMAYINRLEQEIKRAEEAMPKIIEGDAVEIERGIARLTLTIVELLRRLMEREAVRQVKMNYLTQAQKQKLGISLKAIAKKMEYIKKTFGLKDKDLNLDLGPLGNLM